MNIRTHVWSQVLPPELSGVSTIFLVLVPCQTLSHHHWEHVDQVLPPELPPHPSLRPSLSTRLATHPGIESPKKLRKINSVDFDIQNCERIFLYKFTFHQLWLQCLIGWMIFLFQVKFETHQHSIGGIIGNAYWPWQDCCFTTRIISFCKLDIA